MLYEVITEAFIKKVYSECQAISIDYGIMEKATNVYVLTAEFGWSDLGTWGALYDNEIKDEAGNLIKGDNILTYDVRNCIIDISGEKAAVIQGLDGYIVAESNETLMICRLEDEDQIKKFVRITSYNVCYTKLLRLIGKRRSSYRVRHTHSSVQWKRDFTQSGRDREVVYLKFTERGE